jgi:hypothetical protein
MLAPRSFPRGATVFQMTREQPVPEAPESDKTEIVLHDVDRQLCELVKKLQLRIRAPIDGDDAVRAGRLKAILSLYDVGMFLNAIGAGQDVANHFADLATLFDDLNRGARVPPILVPAPSRGNRPEVSILWELRGDRRARCRYSRALWNDRGRGFYDGRSQVSRAEPPRHTT